MDRITIDKETLGKLGGIQDVVELFDEEGRAIGRIVPAREISLAEVEAQCPHTPEELDALQAHAEREDGRPLADIWKDLDGK